MRTIIRDGKRLALLTAALFLIIGGAMMWLANNGIVRAQVAYTIQQPTIAATATTSVPGFTCNWAISSVCRVAVNATVLVTPSFINAVDGGHYELQLVNAAVGQGVPLPNNVMNNRSTTQATATALANMVDVIQMDFVASPLSTATAQYYATQ